MNYVILPVIFLRFWFLDSPVALFKFFVSLNSAFFRSFSLPLLLRTYFKPLKNEYRPGLVKFSIAMGIFVKTFFIITDLLILIFLLFVEISIFIAYVLFPFATLALLFL
ncbi:MAG TPA: hypothetical protein VLF93_04955 [Candidatus Saccharimonadales bacterium]|nr:hypothetical protein [Candidatus Saccharimonadales bacterium]